MADISTNSILDDIKKLLGLHSSETSFDLDVILNINSAFFVVNQLGIGPATPFTISDNTATWADFAAASTFYEPLKIYIYLKVKVVFDPNPTGAVLDAINRQIAELENRLMMQKESDDLPVV